MSDVPYEDGPNVIAYKVRQLAKTAADLITWQRTVDSRMQAAEASVKDVKEDVLDMKKEISSLRKTLVGFALTIAGSSVFLSLSILVATGKVF